MLVLLVPACLLLLLLLLVLLATTTKIIRRTRRFHGWHGQAHQDAPQDGEAPKKTAALADVGLAPT